MEINFEIQLHVSTVKPAFVITSILKTITWFMRP
jgi:hypothetical protein